jgi:hypothetical protein
VKELATIIKLECLEGPTVGTSCLVGNILGFVVVKGGENPSVVGGSYPKP